MGNTYKIIEGDCLSRIAHRLGLSIAELQAMNSDQIKNVDLIYAGNLLNIPGEETQQAPEQAKPSQVSESRVQLPKVPEAPNDVCEAKEYVDVLFYPSMPKTGKQGWFAITQDAKEKLEEEIANMRSIMQAILAGGVDDAMMELSKYGILSKFQSNDHERFLEEQDDKDRYRSLLFLQLALKLELVSVPEVLFTQAQDGQKISQEFYGQYLDAYKDQEFWEHCKNAFGFALKGALKQTLVGAFLDDPTREDLKLNYREIRKDAIADVMKQLEKEIERLEKRARNEAKKKVTDDGTPFFYSEKMGYFTSKQQNTIHKALANVHKARGMYSLELSDICEDEPDDLLKRLKLWQQDGSVASKLTPYEFKARFAGRFVPIFILNTNNMVLIEQCLTDDELIGTEPETVKYYKKLDSAAEKKLIAEIYKKIPDLHTADTISGEALPWSYYPCLALKEKLEASLKSKMAKIQNLLGVGKLPKEILGDLVYCKKAILARIEYFETTAKSNAKAKQYQRLFTKPDKVYTPVLKEKDWKPAKKMGSLYTDAGKADLSVVECYLSSEKGRMAFVRGPSWLTPEKTEDWANCNGHFLDLKPGLNKTVDGDKPAAKKNRIEGDNPIPEPQEELPTTDTELDKRTKAYIAKLAKQSTIKANFKESLLEFDKALVKKVYEWTPDGTEINETAYHASAECQFMRFSAAVSVGDQIDGSKLADVLENQNVKFGLVDAKAALNLAQGQSTITVDYPSATGHPVNIPYIAYLPAKKLKIKQAEFYKAAREEQPRLFNGGNLKLTGQFTVYGIVGASINLGASIELGNLDQGGVGVKGFTETYQGYNAYRKEGPSIRNADSATLVQSKAADITATAGVFAGVEAGGEFVGSLLWRKPKAKKFISFGKFSAKAAAAFAVSASGVIKLTVSGGKIIFIMAAKLALGPGAGGKVAFEISPLAINDFIDHILTIMDKEGFRRLNLFDEGIDPESGENSFELFNMFLTAVMVTNLKAADVLLLPFEQIQAFNEESTREKLAPVLADFINDEAEKALPWVKKMPPETLGRLLYTLTDQQTYDFKEKIIDLRSENTPKYDKDVEYDVKQRNAIQRIMLWLVDGSLVNGGTKGLQISYSPPSEKQRRHFEETLIRMSGKGEKPEKYTDEWQALLGNLRRMIHIYEAATKTENNNKLNVHTRDNMINRFRGLLSDFTRDYQFYIDKGYFDATTNYAAIYKGDCLKDLKEQTARREAVEITADYKMISVMDIEGKA